MKIGNPLEGHVHNHFALPPVKYHQFIVVEDSKAQYPAAFLDRPVLTETIEMEIEKMFRRLTVAEKLLEEKGLEGEYEQMIKDTVIDPEIDNGVNSIFIELVGNIVTQCE